MSSCIKCDDNKYILLACYPGCLCGCGGLPTQMTNCKQCNPLGDADLPDDEDFRFYAEHAEYIGERLDNR